MTDWNDYTEALQELAALRKRHVSIDDCCRALNQAGVNGPRGAGLWTPGLVRSAEQTARTRGLIKPERAPRQGSPRAAAAVAARSTPSAAARPPAPPVDPPPDEPEATTSHAAALARVLAVRWSALEPVAWQAHVQSTAGRVEVRQVLAAVLLEQTADAAQDGSASGATRSVGLLTKLLDVLHAPEIETGSADRDLASLEALVARLTDGVLLLNALIGRDGVLAILQVRETDVTDRADA